MIVSAWKNGEVLQVFTALNHLLAIFASFVVGFTDRCRAMVGIAIYALFVTIIMTAIATLLLHVAVICVATITMSLLYVHVRAVIENHRNVTAMLRFLQTRYHLMYHKNCVQFAENLSIHSNHVHARVAITVMLV